MGLRLRAHPASTIARATALATSAASHVGRDIAEVAPLPVVRPVTPLNSFQPHGMAAGDLLLRPTNVRLLHTRTDLSRTSFAGRV